MKSPNVVVPLPTQVGGLAGTAALNDAAPPSSWAATRPGFADATAEMARNAAATATTTEARTTLIGLLSGLFAYPDFRSRRSLRPQRVGRIAGLAELIPVWREVIGAGARVP